MADIKFTVTLNGTDKNPFAQYGLTQNPFSQHPKYEYAQLNNVLNNLAAEPINDLDDLRRRLRGASEEFVNLCCLQFRKGETVKFQVSFPE